MNLIFRELLGNTAPPAPGEVHVHLRDELEPRKAEGIAALVLQLGLDALRRGPGEATTLVVNCAFLGPTFDDMLAATFTRLLLEGRTLPEGCKTFAHYAAVLRQGMRPTSLPLEETLEGMFCAVRNAGAAAGKEPALTDAAVAERFTRDWAKMDAAILAAIEQNVDPLRQSVFSGRAEFAQERAFILGDYETYLTDVARGQTWLVRLPDGPPVASGLLLVEPRSLAFRQWAWTDRAAPVGGHYLLLAVNWGKGQWVFSTHPARRLSIASLAAELQKVERARNPKAEGKDAWFDGPQFNHTLVAAPIRGSVLPDAEVVRIAKRWARARTAAPFPAWMKGAALAGAVLLVTLGLVFALRDNKEDPTPRAIVDGKQVPLLSFPAAKGARPEFVFELNEPMEKTWQFDIRLPDANSQSHDGKLKVKLKADEKPVPASDFTVTFNGQPMKLVAGRSSGEFISQDYQHFSRQAARVSVTLTKPPATTVWAKATWMPVSDLYIVAVGVSEYQDPALNLSYAVDDAKELAKALHQKKGDLFKNVHAKVLTNENATRKNTFQALDWLRERATAFDMAFVSLSGHGITLNERFCFLPHDYDRAGRTATVVSSVDLLDNLTNLSAYTKILVLDTCYSGEVLRGIQLPASTQSGLWVLAASMQESEVRKEWRHGPVTRALLDVLNEKNAAPVTVRHLTTQAYERLKALRESGRSTPPVIIMPSNSESWDVPIAGGTP